MLEAIWESCILSNNGPYHRRFEVALASHLGVAHIALVSNATLGLLLALRQSGMRGKVLTTPFSFVGTSHALAWAGLEPVFVDIDPTTFNMDPQRLPAALEEGVGGILPVHCFGRPCDTDAIKCFAEANALPIVYDAAHAFGVRDPDGSILRHGDFAVLSFHATKVFNTFEGGAVICHDEADKHAIDLLRNFGIEDEVNVSLTGLNAKLNEFQSALGLLQLDHVDECVAARAECDALYRERLAGIPGIQMPAWSASIAPNFYNFSILVGEDYPLDRDTLAVRLKQDGIVARRYFYPLISDLPMYRNRRSSDPCNLPVARRVSSSILGLPIYPGLAEADQHRIATIIRNP